MQISRNNSTKIINIVQIESFIVIMNFEMVSMPNVTCVKNKIMHSKHITDRTVHLKFL